jgi:hypothetical protein
VFSLLQAFISASNSRTAAQVIKQLAELVMRFYGCGLFSTEYKQRNAATAKYV